MCNMDIDDNQQPCPDILRWLISRLEPLAATPEHAIAVNSIIGELQCELDRQLPDMSEMLIDSIVEFARGHHTDQEPCVWLHALLVDIPSMCDALRLSLGWFDSPPDAE